jgi:hypothetical protein
MNIVERNIMSQLENICIKYDLGIGDHEDSFGVTMKTSNEITEKGREPFYNSKVLFNDSRRFQDIFNSVKEEKLKYKTLKNGGKLYIFFKDKEDARLMGYILASYLLTMDIVHGTVTVIQEVKR